MTARIGTGVQDRRERQDTWTLLCERLGRDPATSEESDTCTLRAAYKAMIAFASARPDAGDDAGVVQTLRAALTTIAYLRPSGDVERCVGARKLVERMERVALSALAQEPRA